MTFRSKPPIVPDWQKNRLTVVDPAIWPIYRSPRCDLRLVYSDLLGAFRSLGVSCDILTKEDCPVDIWIRDWGPIENCYFDFCPSYAKGWYSVRSIAQARRYLDRRRAITPRRIPLVLDGGNLVHNGQIGIVTEKVWLDNPQLSKREVERGIISIGLEQVAVIPIEPSDTMGHADGIVRFIDKGRLLVNDYERVEMFRGYGRRLRRRLEQQLPRVSLIPFPWFPTNDKIAGVWGARGSYINMVHTKGCLVYPTFDSPMDEEVAALLRTLLCVPTRAIAANALAQLGGVLNCIVLPL